jgi:hypothetical protein
MLQEMYILHQTFAFCTQDFHTFFKYISDHYNKGKDTVTITLFPVYARHDHIKSSAFLKKFYNHL